MKKQKKFTINGKNLASNQGLSLLEVLIATSLFFIFFTAFVSSQADNLLDSQHMSEELFLHNLAENTINDILISPPPLKASGLSKPETKKFEQDGLDDYEYDLEFKPFDIPDGVMKQFSAGLGGGSGEDEGTDGGDEEQGQNPQTQALKLLMKEFQENLKKALWQVRVTIRNKESGQEYYLTSFLRNPQYQIKFKFPSIPAGFSSSSGGAQNGN